ncbi:hypothetical protein ACX1C1_08380 [Paenibacillus sp. strain BS8-2]
MGFCDAPGNPNAVEILTEGEVLHVIWKNATDWDLLIVAVDWKVYGAIKDRRISVQRGSGYARIEGIEAGRTCKVSVISVDETDQDDPSVK